MTPGITTYATTCDIEAPAEHREWMVGDMDAQMAMVAGWEGRVASPTGEQEWAVLGWSGEGYVTEAECAALGVRWVPSLRRLTRWYEVGE